MPVVYVVIVFGANMPHYDYFVYVLGQSGEVLKITKCLKNIEINYINVLDFPCRKWIILSKEVKDRHGLKS